MKKIVIGLIAAVVAISGMAAHGARGTSLNLKQIASDVEMLKGIAEVMEYKDAKKLVEVVNTLVALERELGVGSVNVEVAADAINQSNQTVQQLKSKYSVFLRMTEQSRLPERPQDCPPGAEGCEYAPAM